jgi:hypothetical protein
VDQRDSQAGQDIRQGAWEDDQPGDLVACGAERLRGADAVGVDAAHPACGRDRQRCEDREIDQQNFRGLADTEPDHQQRQIGQWRHRPVEFDQWIQGSVHPRIQPHGHAGGDGGDHREQHRQAHPRQAGGCVLGQGRTNEAVAREIDDAPGDLSRPRQEQRRHQAACRNSPPDGQHPAQRGEGGDGVAGPGITRHG